MSASGRIEVRVYYEDTDFSGSVYHAAYLKFFERGRTELLRAADIHHAELAAQGIAFAVRTMEVSFERAARIDDLLTIETEVEAVGGARLTLRQSIHRDGEVLVTARVVVVSVRLAGGAARLPALLRERFGAETA